MKMYLVKTPQIIKNLFPNFVWNIPTKEKVLYLTFDDGPHPAITPWVLDQLQQYEAKATFFCVGENIQRYPDVFQRILDEGHSVGNHTQTHVNGWGSENMRYFHDVRHCARLVNSSLFRPPYGRLLPRQAQFLQRHYRIVMWDVLSGDFDPNISMDQCLSNVLRNARKGSIVVFHDSLKSKEKLQHTLPLVMEHFAEKGFRFAAVEQAQVSQAQTA